MELDHCGESLLFLCGWKIENVVLCNQITRISGSVFVSRVNLEATTNMQSTLNWPTMMMSSHNNPGGYSHDRKKSLYAAYFLWFSFASCARARAAAKRATKRVSKWVPATLWGIQKTREKLCAHVCANITSIYKSRPPKYYKIKPFYCR